ncbi:SDR family oxidoreductase [Virgibacillus salexigens]|uniref:SDR family oxidoreductase n=1 Tax=Virgibacillus TaxID=84406 RepID=UPI001369CB72|nr:MULTISPECIES: SDR family oxidoreductase [Virgibacillus]MYL40067.1 glucose 1-dehydrogenase [Virgibacillus massiliensis]
MSVTELFNLAGKTAIITGGGRGLGAHIAEAYAESGANVILCSRKIDACKEKSEELMQRFDIDALACECDISKQEDVKKVVEATVEHFGRIDILVNNSGATWGAPVIEMPFEAWEKVINVNITGTYLMSLEVGKIMIQQKQGKIINLASVAGFGGSDPTVMNTIGYNTSKGAVMTFTKDLAVKWGKYNIKVNAIAPGFFPTKMSKGLLDKGGDKILAGTPLNRFGKDEDIKGAALFLASRASDFVTGDILRVDGGSSAYA